MVVKPLKEALEKVGLGRSTFLEKSANDPDFPKSVKLSANRVGWLEHELDEWIANRAAERPGQQLKRRLVELESEREQGAA